MQCRLHPSVKIFLDLDSIHLQAFYIIFHGHVAVLVKGTQVAVLGEGNSFGELGLDNKTCRTATVKVSWE